MQRVSREIAGTNNSPLSRELVSAGVYKPNQGRIVRQLTCLAIWIIVGLACWALYSFIRGGNSGSSTASITVGVLLALGIWTGFRLVNWPRFADFLIAVEAEMNKVCPYHIQIIVAVGKGHIETKICYLSVINPMVRF